ncbi:hypothetical protein SSABA_v1c02300 [Spiroplasma sabaudiense Ar-1343]|uniref:N-acetyltransferase domain-containing protein n=1 Tax=Spiroplasma sabaudiense Ar-1343 TaxID=1276257 RepID=W6A9D9_9MOLU|nr:GNAT family N-acetyltransferase [Spiroplasma sabaudiense]AHI53642.1 hypothetical protein SSABA_v1c02300 [Spiroplasma sabaudiense Ar-1343]
MFKLKNKNNEILVNNFIKYNNDINLNNGLIKIVEHQKGNFIEVDSSRTDLKINFLYSHLWKAEEDKELAIQIIKKYNQIDQNLVYVMIDEDQRLQENQFQDLGLYFDVKYKAMVMDLEKAYLKEIKIPTGFTLKNVELEDLEEFKKQIDDGFGSGVIDTTKYKALVELNKVKKICHLIVVYHNNQAVATGNIYFENNYGVVDDITVNSKMRGQGLASVVLNNLFLTAKKQGIKKLLLVSTKDGFPIYEKMGFERTGLNLMIYKIKK